MKILHVAQNIPVPGTHGGSTHVTEVSNALRERHDVLVLARRGSTGDGVAGIGFGSLPGPLRYAVPGLLFASALRHARRFRPDVVYERYSSFGLGVFLGRALGVPVASMVLNEEATRLTLSGADALVATDAALVPERFRAKVFEVSWGANVEHFRPDVSGAEVRRRLGFGASDVVVGYSGGFYPWHGLETLVEAARLLADEGGVDLRYLMVGEGEERHRTEAMVQHRGLGDRFTFVGPVPYADVPTYVAASDICVAAYDPGRHRQFRRRGLFMDPLKVFEALAAGRATVTLDSENLRRLFVDGEHVRLVPGGDVPALAKAVARLARDPSLRQDLGRRGRKLVVERHSWSTHGASLGALFERLIEERRSRAS